MVSDVTIICSRSKCKRPAVVCRQYVGINPYPVLIAYLCSDCKDIPLWNEEEDIIHEEKIMEV
ncbi:MAG: hypothetical protein HY223_00180 [Thaumarchaeota archaeon]|nr:hypothetical protein [Nitrososphaerota archaeon]